MGKRKAVRRRLENHVVKRSPIYRRWRFGLVRLLLLVVLVPLFFLLLLRHGGGRTRRYDRSGITCSSLRRRSLVGYKRVDEEATCGPPREVHALHRIERGVSV